MSQQQNLIRAMLLAYHSVLTDAEMRMNPSSHVLNVAVTRLKNDNDATQLNNIIKHFELQSIDESHTETRITPEVDTLLSRDSSLTEKLRENILFDLSALYARLMTDDGQFYAYVVEATGEHTIPVLFYLYYDETDQKLKTYISTRNNLINTETKTAYGVERRSTRYDDTKLELYDNMNRAVTKNINTVLNTARRAGFNELKQFVKNK